MTRPSRQSDLFAAAKPLPVYRCDVCGQEACYGLGWPAAPSERWFCRAHVPAGFLPADRLRSAA